MAQELLAESSFTLQEHATPAMREAGRVSLFSLVINVLYFHPFVQIFNLLIFQAAVNIDELDPAGFATFENETHERFQVK